MRLDRICAVVPAAGRASRLGLDRPKILAPVTPGETIWSILRAKLARHVDHIQVVLSPAAAHQFAESAAAELESGFVSISLQEEPRGMGDAIFCGEAVWSDYQTLMVVWGDQVHVSNATLRRTLTAHRSRRGARCTFPVVVLDHPYVQYDFNNAGRLVQVRQSREGDEVDERGLSDVGTFVLEGDGLRQAWDAYQSIAARGRLTGELNFLPFLTFLTREAGWDVRQLEIDDAQEARGVNTPADLEFFRRHYERGVTSC